MYASFFVHCMQCQNIWFCIRFVLCTLAYKQFLLQNYKITASRKQRKQECVKFKNSKFLALARMGRTMQDVRSNSISFEFYRFSFYLRACHLRVFYDTGNSCTFPTTQNAVRMRLLLVFTISQHISVWKGCWAARTFSIHFFIYLSLALTFLCRIFLTFFSGRKLFVFSLGRSSFGMRATGRLSSIVAFNLWKRETNKKYRIRLLMNFQQNNFPLNAPQ